MTVRRMVVLTGGAALGRVAGISVIERLIAAAADAGFEDIIILVEPDSDAIRRHVVTVSRERRIAVRRISDERHMGDGPFLVVVADRVVSPALLELTKVQRLRPGEVMRLEASNVIIESPKGGTRRTLPTGPEHWSLPARSARERRIAARRLVRESAKPYDGTIALRINRPLSDIITLAVVSLFPATTSVQVTLFGLLVAGGAACAFALGAPIAAAFLIQAALILDRVDGHVARATAKPSAFGCYLDPVLDRASDGLVLIGAGIYLARADAVAAVAGPAQVPLAIAVSGLALLSHVLVSYTSAKAIIELGHWYRGTWLGIGHGRDRRMLAVSAGALLTLIDPAMVIVALVSVTAFSTWIVVTRLCWSWWLSGRGSAISGVRTVVLDFDGTIADSMGYLTRVATELLVERGGLTRSDAAGRYLATAGTDFHSQLAEIIPGHAATISIEQRFEAAKQAWMPRCELFPDVVPALRKLSSAGARVFVCSSTSRPLVHEFCRRKGLLRYLTSVDGWRQGHDKSTQLVQAVAASRVAPNNVVFIGDSRRDADLARATGLRFVGLAREASRDVFEESGTYSIRSLLEFAHDLRRGSRAPIELTHSVVNKR